MSFTFTGTSSKLTTRILIRILYVTWVYILSAYTYHGCLDFESDTHSIVYAVQNQGENYS